MPDPPAPLVFDRQLIAALVNWLPGKRLLRWLFLLWALAVIGLSLTGLLLHDSYARELAIAVLRCGFLGIGVIVLVLLVFVIGVLLLESLDLDGVPALERQWGTLGQGVQGWTMSRSLTLLLLFGFVVGLFALLVSQALQVPSPSATAAATTVENAPSKTAAGGPANEQLGDERKRTGGTTTEGSTNVNEHPSVLHGKDTGETNKAKP